MISQNEYQQKLKTICEEMQKSFRYKIGIVSAMSTKKCLKKIIRLNKQTENNNITELRYVLGRTKLEYKKYCNSQNYYTDPYVNGKIKEAYFKLSRKALKLQTKKANISKMSEKFDIEYNSNRGSYIFKITNNGKTTYSKEYRIKNLKNLNAKRRHAIERLERANFGLNIFDELEVNEKNVYKINPDILHILLNEGKVDFAKLYIKEVLGGETLNNPLKIKYVLNRDIKEGKFSPEENKAMKKMARLDRLANELIIVSKKREKIIEKPKMNVVEYLTPYFEAFKRALNTTKRTPAFAGLSYNYGRADKIRDIKARADERRLASNNIFNASFRNANTGKITAFGMAGSRQSNYRRNFDREER